VKSAILCTILIFGCGAFAAERTPSGPQETVIYTFQDQGDGASPSSGVITDASGNLYGTMATGVYEVSPPSLPGGPWTESVLYTFQGGTDGSGPHGNLVFDSAGNLYGTTSYGGGSYTNCTSGCGTIFELSPTASGTWTKTTLYTFLGGPTDGQLPNGSLVFDSAGNLYGTTEAGGNQQCSFNFPTCGTIFQLAPPSAPGAPWTESVIYLFQGGSDGEAPLAGLTIDPEQNFYGTTAGGGQDQACKDGCGTVFKLKRPSVQGDPWTEKVIQRFHDDSGGQQPRGPVTIHSGALYGTTYTSISGGPTVFELSLVNGVVTNTYLYNFQGEICVGSYAGVTFDHSGNIYTTASAVGCEGGGGFVYELRPPKEQGGNWTEITFPGMDGGATGNVPVGGVTIFGDALYGATYQGGNLNCGGEGFGCGLVYSYGP
jgi:uncharacterized repeat protein (TIGR03803 family)